MTVTQEYSLSVQADHLLVWKGSQGLIGLVVAMHRNDGCETAEFV
ncbi:MAG: hypothetical protein V2A73_03790 [Pseudomonadota bacterium]